MSESNNMFELEQQIMQCWNVIEDIKLIYEYVGDDYFFKDMDPKHADKIMNLLLGMSELYEVKFEKTFATFEEVCKQYWQLRKGNTGESDDTITVTL